MKLDVIALAGALLALTTAAVQASPASVVPDTAHAIGRDATQVVRGTAKGFGDQARHDYHAGARVTHDVAHGVVPRHAHYRHRHLIRRVSRTHTVAHTHR